MILIEKYIDFITTNNLTQDQYLLLHLLYDNRVDLIRKYKTSFPSGENSMISRTLVDDLITREFLVKTDKGFKLGDKFKEIFVTPELAVDEFYDIYPAFVESDKGVSIPLISMDKKYFQELYIPKIFGNHKEHQEVIEDIEYGKMNNLITMGIKKFLTSDQWKALRKLRKQENTTVNTETNESFS